MGEPGIIKKLSEHVVNRIAAGEIVQRPANALKELIENSLDAKSTNIVITVKAGGLKYLQVLLINDYLLSTLGPRDSLRQKFKKINILIVVSQYVYENLLYVKKNIDKFEKFSDAQHITTINDRLVPIVSKKFVHPSWANVYASTTSFLKISRQCQLENLRKLLKPGCAFEIQDNGTGIRSDDLEIVCERFSTSKLKEYEDLKQITTYGFRGEALASISHIAHLTILTKTASAKCAYKASYEDGKLKAPVKPCAGNNGTQITVEDLFYNVIARKKALRSPTEEYSHIMEVVGGYAIHNNRVGFTLKKFGENTDLKTPINSSVVENVRIIHGNTVARELMPIELDEPTLKLSLRGYITNVNYSHKKGTMLLFINHRLVDWQSIRKAIDSIYSTYLPKNSHSFVYLSLELDPRNIDVNVHPTKHEVQFLYEEQIIEKIKSCIESKLLSCNSTRIMYTQARLPGATAVEEIVKKTTDSVKVNPSYMVRVDADMQKIDKFFPTISKQVTENDENQKEIPEIDDLVDKDNDENVIDNSLVEEPIIKNKIDKWKIHTAVDQANISYIDPKESFKTRTFKYERIETKLTSVKQLRLDIESSCNNNLREVLANLIFIACIDCHKSLIQHSTKLYLCNTTRFTEELFYETILYDFQNLGLIKLSSPLPLEELLTLGLDTESEWDPQLGEMRDMATQMCELLVSKRAMLNEYFSLEINSAGELLALPLVLDGHTPFMGALPTYLVRLATEVNWESEKECFDTFSRQTAIFYSQPNPDKSPENIKAEEWKQEHIIFPTIRRNFLPPSSFVHNGAILQIASLNDLYKVFERC